MTWTTIPDSNIEPGKAVRSVDMIAMRDNIPALANGDPGAPRIQTAAINDAAVTAPKLATTTAERDWVLGRTAGADVGAVGTYALMVAIGVMLAAGQTIAGSSLRYTSISQGINTPIPSGTWICMGFNYYDVGAGSYGTLFLRIA